MQTMPAGKYWIGDLCYVFSDGDWDQLMQLMWPFKDKHNRDRQVDGRLVLPNGVAVSYHSTAYGDGRYEDEQGNEYPVDAGLIGCVKWSDIDATHRKNAKKSGHVHEFHFDFTTSYEEGTIHFGGVVSINTDPQECDE